ncbi:MAG: hypothetical protein ACRCTY_04690 [Candidatus Adiutrix sp.]
MKQKILILPLLISTLFLLSCFGQKNMELTYNVRQTSPLKNFTVYLVVNDLRTNQSLVGNGARNQGLFKELYGGHFDLRINMPNGSKITMTSLTATQAVWESISRRLQAQGVNATTHRAQAHLTMEINIEQMNIDVQQGDLVAQVHLASRIFRDENAVHTSHARATSNRIKLIGGTGGTTVLSDALSQAVNELDLNALNKF